MMIALPITVKLLDIKKGHSLYQPGGLVEVRPCGKEYGGKTYVGLFLGDLPTTPYVLYTEGTKVLTVSTSTNPAIYVPELNKIIYGMESWWRRIERIEDATGVSDGDIENCWYVKLLKTMQKEKKE